MTRRLTIQERMSIEIAERKRAEEQLQAYAAAMESTNRALEESNRRVKQAAQAKSEFPATVVEDTAEMLAVKSHEKRLRLVCLLDPDLPAQVRGDPSRLRQILLNLGGNAVKFTQQGEVRIDVSVKSRVNRRLAVERIVSLEVAGMTIFCLAKLAESKDRETGNHLERIRGYSKVLAVQLAADEEIARKFPARFPELIHQTSPLHDIGKVGIPDSILLKPGSLNDAEWVVMKRHTEIGAETLDAALRAHPGAEFLRIARDIAWCHHERWDGSGYPRGMKGDEIPWGARIVALADVYDALTTRRVYKAAMPHDVARGIILQGTGNHFDPRVVQAFLAVEQQFLNLQENLAEPVAEPALAAVR